MNSQTQSTSFNFVNGKKYSFTYDNGKISERIVLVKHNKDDSILAVENNQVKAFNKKYMKDVMVYMEK